MTSARARWRGGALVWGALLVTSLLLAIPGTSSAEVVTCDDEVVTILGTAGDDVIVGTNGDDVIHGLGGDDLIYGMDGQDRICGGDGFDDLRGGDHADRMFGGKRADKMYGNRGYDFLFGGRGHDTMFGGDGDDFLAGRRGNDRINGGGGADTVVGNEHDDVLIGGPGPDEVYGSEGTDRCAGNTEVNCELDVIDFRQVRFFVNQAVPAADSDEPAANRTDTVAGRQGIVRAFVTANQPGIPAPTVHLYVKQGGTSVRHEMSGPAVVPESASVGDLATTYNYVLPDDYLQAGAEMFVLVDRLDQTFELKEGNNRYPSTGWADINAKALPTMSITVVPTEGQTVSQSEAEAWFAKTFQVHPVDDVDITVRPGNYTCQLCSYSPLGNANDWVQLVEEILDLQQDPVENPTERMYHAILPNTWSESFGISGIGWIGYPAAVSVPNQETIAHETGHNLDLKHVLCTGSESNPDLAYPYENGSIGKWGYNPVTEEVYDPAVYVDLMTYCNTEWISDYSYQKALDHRIAVGYETDAYGLAAPGTGTVVHFGGYVPPSASAVANLAAMPAQKRLAVTRPTQLEPLRIVEHRAVPPAPGDHLLIGRDATGETLVRVSFRAYSLDHAPIARFSFSIELSSETLNDVTSWSVERDGSEIASRPGHSPNR